MTQTLSQQNYPLVEQFMELTPQEFGSTLNNIWKSVERIKDSVIDEVEQNNLPPITALGMVSCVTGQALGYQWFHGKPSPVDIATLYSRQ